MDGGASETESARVRRETVRSGQQRTRTLRPQIRLRELVRDYERSEEHTSELQSQSNLVCRLLLEKKKSFVCGDKAVFVVNKTFFVTNKILFGTNKTLFVPKNILSPILQPKGNTNAFSFAFNIHHS